MTRRLAALAALTLSACGSSEMPQAAPPAHRPYKDLPEVVCVRNRLMEWRMK